MFPTILATFGPTSHHMLINPFKPKNLLLSHLVEVISDVEIVCFNKFIAGLANSEQI